MLDLVAEAKLKSQRPTEFPPVPLEPRNLPDIFRLLIDFNFFDGKSEGKRYVENSGKAALEAGLISQNELIRLRQTNRLYLYHLSKKYNEIFHYGGFPHTNTNFVTLQSALQAYNIEDSPRTLIGIYYNWTLRYFPRAYVIPNLAEPPRQIMLPSHRFIYPKGFEYD